MSTHTKINLKWVDAVKAFAILGILLNHLIETFGPGPWFTNPSGSWPDIAARMQNLIPDGNIIKKIITFAGWLGDSGPGVFILISGLTLTLSAYRKSNKFDTKDFYSKRLTRIFPLYVTIHILILLLAIFVPGNHLNTGNQKVFMSLLGLRFTDGLFYFINPSWWFIWLILQLYIVFPFLFNLLQKTGVKQFFIITIGFTILSRLAGIIGIRYSDHLSFWMNGIFFGTRLGEFAIGMVIGRYLWNNDFNIEKHFTRNKIAVFSFAIYIAGFTSSLFLPTTLISNMLVSSGLTGLFYSIFRYIFSNSKGKLAKAIIWLGVYSYGLYLLHQAPLRWSGCCFHGAMHYVAAVVILGLSIPAAFAIERAIPLFNKKIILLKERKETGKLVIAVDILLVLLLLFIEPKISMELKSRIFSLGLLLVIVFQLLFSSIILKNKNPLLFIFHWSVIIISIIQLFFFPFKAGNISVFAGLFILLIAFLLNSVFKKQSLAIIISAVFVYSAILITEGYLTKHFPVETGKWGEYPALLQHPTRVYGLKPNKTTHLKYNNYDYILKTNSFGLPSPEIAPEKNDSSVFRILIIGDAFAMPEGMGYEKSFPHLLENELQIKYPKKTIQVINAGVTGYGPMEESAQLAELCSLFKPDIVVYEFFINEFEEASLTPEKRLQSIGFLPPPGQIKNTKLIDLNQIIFRFNKLKNTFVKGKNNGSSKWKYRKALLYYYEKHNDKLYDTKHINKVASYIEKMKLTCDEYGAKFKIYFVPGQVAVSKPENISYFPEDIDISDTSKFDLYLPNKEFREIADSLDIQFLDLTPFLKSNPNQPVYYKESWHWNQQGHKVVAKIIANDINLN